MPDATSDANFLRHAEHRRGGTSDQPCSSWAAAGGLQQLVSITCAYREEERIVEETDFLHQLALINAGRNTNLITRSQIIFADARNGHRLGLYGVTP